MRDVYPCDSEVGQFLAATGLPFLQPDERVLYTVLFGVDLSACRSEQPIKLPWACDVRLITVITFALRDETAVLAVVTGNGSPTMQERASARYGHMILNPSADQLRLLARIFSDVNSVTGRDIRDFQSTGGPPEVWARSLERQVEFGAGSYVGVGSYTTGSTNSSPVVWACGETGEGWANPWASHWVNRWTGLLSTSDDVS